MFERLLGKARSEVPRYSRIRAGTPPLPRAVLAAEESAEFARRAEGVREQLLREPLRPAEDQPLFTTLARELPSVLLITLPDGGQCLPLFTTPFKAADYMESIGAAGQFSYLAASPAQALQMLGDLVEMAGVGSFALDRCPRCGTFGSVATRSLRSAEHLLTLWSIVKGTELARADLYFAFALQSARTGALERARDVALETAGHVTFEDARVHLLIGQLAVALRDRGLLAEARAFLARLPARACEEKLAEVERSGKPDFAGPASAVVHPHGYPTSGWTSRLPAAGAAP